VIGWEQAQTPLPAETCLQMADQEKAEAEVETGENQESPETAASADAGGGDGNQAPTAVESDAPKEEPKAAESDEPVSDEQVQAAIKIQSIGRKKRDQKRVDEIRAQKAAGAPEEAAKAGEAAETTETTDSNAGEQEKGDAGESEKPATGEGETDKPATGEGETDKPATGEGEADKPATGEGEADKPATGEGETDKSESENAAPSKEGNTEDEKAAAAAKIQSLGRKKRDQARVDKLKADRAAGIEDMSVYTGATLTCEGRLPYFTAAEVRARNVPDNCWVSLLGRVLDVTSIIKDHGAEWTEPLIRMAGEDISHWFDEQTGDLCTRIDPDSGLRSFCLPGGRLVHVPPCSPSTEFDMGYRVPWYKRKDLVMGKLSQRVRKLRVVNMLLRSEEVIDVCSEQTVSEIRDSFKEYNAHAGSYTWKRLASKDEGMVKLNMASTLADNGIPDESEEFERMALDESLYLAAVYLYFNDDLTEA